MLYIGFIFTQFFCNQRDHVVSLLLSPSLTVTLNTFALRFVFLVPFRGSFCLQVAVEAQTHPKTWVILLFPFAAGFFCVWCLRKLVNILDLVSLLLMRCAGFCTLSILSETCYIGSDFLLRLFLTYFIIYLLF